MATISGNCNRERVIVIHQDDHVPVVEATPDANGDWSAEVPAGAPMMVIYIQAGCQPEMHGPYYGD